MVDFDEAIDILENRARRDILRYLVKEPHYPLQLSELLEISQQAVMKHVKILEKAGFIGCRNISVKGLYRAGMRGWPLPTRLRQTSSNRFALVGNKQS